jgi:hypothetical protein
VEYRVKTRYVLAAACGNSAAGSASSGGCKESPATTRIIDLTPPTLSCKTVSTQFICVDDGTKYVNIGTAWDAEVTDNCIVSSITASLELSGATTGSGLTTLDGVQFGIGTTTVTWTASDGCNTAVCNFNITVQSRPLVTGMSTTICSANSFSLTPVNGTNGIVLPGTTYSWSAPSVTGGITGGAAGDRQAAIFGTLVNPTNTVQTATYTVTPNHDFCPGDPFTVTVTVNPVPTIGTINLPVCTGNSFTLIPANGTHGIVPAGTTYTWGVPVVTGGITGGAANNSASGSISGTLFNPTQTAQTATYTVTPVSGACPGPTFTVVVRVNPVPAVTPMTAAICSGNSFTVIPLGGVNGVVPAGTTYTWTAPVVTGGITGGAANSSASGSISGTLFNPTNTPRTATYAVTPVSGSCPGTAFPVVVTVNPVPSVSPMTAAICSGYSFTAIPVNGVNGVVPSGTTYTWTAPVVTGGVTGGAASSSASGSISGTLFNPTQTAQTATYTVTPVSGACPGATFTITVTVNPTPTPTITADYCSVPGKIRLTSSIGDNYLWNTGAVTRSIDIDIAGSYSVKVTDNATGCFGTATIDISVELVRNGDFSDGYSEFTSGYTFRPPWVTPPSLATSSANSSLWNDGYFGVGDNGRYYHTNFWGKDHTSGTGNYLIVNGNTNPGTPIWQQTINVQPNTDYYFSAWSMSLNSDGNDAVLQFEVNGELVGTQARLPAGVSNNSNNGWIRFYSNPTWNSGSLSGPITISIKNVEPAGSGNDFGIDDISFATLLPLPAAVDPRVAGGKNTFCEGETVYLEANVSNGKPPFVFLWTGPDGFTSTEENPVIPNITVAKGGVYTLSVTDEYGCPPDIGTVTVTVNPLPACSITGTNGPVCPGTGMTFTAPAGMSSYAWSVSGNATITGATNQQTVTVTAGTGCNADLVLSLTLVNTYGCTSTCTKTVTVQDLTAPVLANPPSASFCVENIHQASFYAPTIDITPDRPDYYTLQPGDLDLLPATYFSDNCTAAGSLVLHWSITNSLNQPVNDANGNPLTNQTGQVSTHIASVAPIVLLGAPSVNVIYTITYWLTDLCGNPSAIRTATITVTPRPDIIKMN